jgi:hypothetical protein
MTSVLAEEEHLVVLVGKARIHRAPGRTQIVLGLGTELDFDEANAIPAGEGLELQSGAPAAHAHDGANAEGANVLEVGARPRQARAVHAPEVDDAEAGQVEQGAPGSAPEGLLSHGPGHGNDIVSRGHGAAETGGGGLFDGHHVLG